MSNVYIILEHICKCSKHKTTKHCIHISLRLVKQNYKNIVNTHTCCSKDKTTKSLYTHKHIIVVVAHSFSWQVTRHRHTAHSHNRHTAHSQTYSTDTLHRHTTQSQTSCRHTSQTYCTVIRHRHTAQSEVTNILQLHTTNLLYSHTSQTYCSRTSQT